MATQFSTAARNAAAAIVTPTGTPSVRYDWQPGDTATAGAFDVSSFNCQY